MHFSHFSKFGSFVDLLFFKVKLSLMLFRFMAVLQVFF